MQNKNQSQALRVSPILAGATDGSRTRKFDAISPTDFKSVVYASSTTVASIRLYLGAIHL